MSEFPQDNDINRIITLIKSSATNQEPGYIYRYLTYLQKIAMRKYKSYIINEIKERERESQGRVWWSGAL
jgi:hypothetical protein